MNKVLVFKCGEYNFSFDISYIKEIKGWIKPTLLPSTEKHIEGIINIRGAIIPVVDLYNIITGNNNLNKKALIVVYFMEKMISFSVSSVSDIIEYSKINQTPEIFADNTNLINGIIESDNRSIFSINLSMIMEKVIDK
ncbi:chemotaxis protein CheW [Neokomagataea anthophila]|uniref:Chemotaxis protein CheW n=1 Tax=Neokomagataea anthophila TaxID=2826925 RepID=A0ABS5E7W9_9PROT|nr:chemotaxis protein CheW [Neokomagataea anthophila]MBR0560005.1 chemotaxis protein CheW [Neokomagataea anthophila]